MITFAISFDGFSDTDATYKLGILKVDDIKNLERASSGRHYILLDGMLFEIIYQGFEWIDRDFDSVLELMNFWVEQLTRHGDIVRIERCPWSLPGNRIYDRVALVEC